MASKEEVPAEAGQAEPEKCSSGKLIFIDLYLRIILFAASLTAMVVMVTSNQTKHVMTPSSSFPVPVKAKFNYSPAYIYFVAALSLSTLYSIITGIGSSWVLVKPCSSKELLKFYLLLIAYDVVMLGIVAAATGTAGGVAYIGLKGNSHVKWNKICNVYGKYCRHIGASVVISLFASFLLVSLVILSAYSVYSLAHKVVI
ncbi:CASP-like protein 1D1 [Macadamia integrifolia]|uniref:CASP-like protein 1D1 n=1 Tax=Macadamia integrifolia TaxID=60698 RepID=UPI001C4EA4F4|nr:CASP-like protein 1D1 [Macadamia integrifolia]